MAAASVQLWQCKQAGRQSSVINWDQNNPRLRSEWGKRSWVANNHLQEEEVVEGEEVEEKLLWQTGQKWRRCTFELD